MTIEAPEVPPTPAAPEAPEGHARADATVRVEPTRRRGVLLGAAAVLAIALGLLALTLDVAARGLTLPTSVDTAAGWVNAVGGLVQLLPGLLILRDRPRHQVGWVLVAAGTVWLLCGVGAAWTLFVVFRHPDLPGAVLGFHLGYRWSSVGLLGPTLLMVLFPDGRFPRGRWRVVALGGLGATALFAVVTATVPVAVARSWSGGTTPGPVAALAVDGLTVELAAWPTLFAVARALPALGLVASLAVVVSRYRTARGVRRQQMAWLLWAGGVGFVALAAGAAAPPVWLTVALVLTLAVTSGAVVVAITRYRLYEIDRLLPTTVVAVLLGLLVLAVDGLVLLVAGAVMGGRDSALVAVAVVAVLYTPLRNRLWSAARRVGRGRRDDPYGAMSTLAGRLESAAAPGEQLAALARSVAEAFRLPYVRVEIDRADGARAVVEHGEPTGPPVTLPVRYREETIGRVVVSGGGRLSDADQRLLGDLLRQAAAAARAGALGASLQRAREALVSAREEERRRLRRDLHDSLGPSLAAVTLRIETARALAERDPAAADAALATATEDVTALLADVRRIVHDLRPPALDQLGLAGALRQQAERLGDGVRAEVRTEGGDLGALPAAVEVAAFRIVSEALTNVVRHAAATRATVTLRREPTSLEVEVADDGRGIDADVAAGVGTLSVRERAAELGGRTTVSCPPEGGTVVAASLPIHSDAREGS